MMKLMRGDMKKKVKLFEDYSKCKKKNHYKVNDNGERFCLSCSISKGPLERKMLNDLANKIHKLEEENKLLDKDNDMLRGWITELQHKMDFFFKVFEINNMNLKDLYQKTLKQSK